jgi:NDP-sugar pyrophosphorylase family protein
LSESKKVIIATYAMASEGLDIKTLTTLIMASPKTDVCQSVGRILRVKDYVGKETFMCTYGDGLANVDIAKLLAFHKSHGKLATMTSVRPVSRFGVLDLADDSSVKSFEEKPQSEGWINAGYFIFEPQVFDYL